MTFFQDATRNYSRFFAILLIGPLLSGCSLFESNPPPPAPVDSTAHAGVDFLQVGDQIRVDFSGTPQVIQPVETDIKGDGNIRLDLVGDVMAAGRTPGELERVIQRRYVPDYYTHLSVTVTPVVRYFYVDGEVSQSGTGGRLVYSGPITVTRAIAAAGGFSPFADRRHVKLFRVGAKSAIKVNCNKLLDHPEQDIPVYPGDRIVVPRRLY